MALHMPAPGQPPGGRRLGRYHLLRRLAAGGMGEVWLAATRGAAGFEKRVAIKRILPHLSEDPDFVDRFIDEAQIVVKLHHGNVVQVLDMDQEGGDYYIAMEYLPGTDLRAVLRRCAELDERLPPALAVYVTSEVCRGLGYAHRKVGEDGRRLHLIHRDVSPSNVLLSWEGTVKVTDFGVASALGRLVDSVAGRLHGKIAYMSPEQAAGEVLDHRSDIYSAGIVCWEMLTGRRLFDGQSDTEVLRRVQEGAVAPPSEAVPGLPDALDAAVLRALARDRSERWQRMEDLADALRQLLFGELGGAAGAPALSEHLQGLFPEEQRSPSQPSLDDALRAGLPDLEREVSRGPATVSARRTGEVAARPAAVPVAAARAPRPVLRWLLALLVAGLAAGYLGALPGAVPSARLQVTSDPPGAEVRLAGRTVAYLTGGHQEGPGLVLAGPDGPWTEICKTDVPEWVEHWLYGMDGDAVLPEPVDRVFLKYVGDPGLNQAWVYVHCLETAPPSSVHVTHGYELDGEVQEDSFSFADAADYEIDCSSEPANDFIQFSVHSQRI